MNYTEAIEWIENRRLSLGSVPGLSCVKDLLRVFDNPQNKLKVIHITGTNGKGSTGTYIKKLFESSGLTVGHFSSPAVIEYREQIKVKNTNIVKNDYAEILSDIVSKMEDDSLSGDFKKATAFEIETVIAYLYFLRKACDICIIEVGMGGELDATNVFANPYACVFTSISEDHVGFLGDTIEKIATIKSGIIKEGAIVVSAPQEISVAEIIEKKASTNNCNYNYVNQNDIKIISQTLNGLTFSYDKYKKYKLSMLGEYQSINASVALKTYELVAAKLGINIPKEEKLKKVMYETTWPCRFEIINKKPYIILDGAHNEGAVDTLMSTFDKYFTKRPIIFIMGVYKDKDYTEIIRKSVTRADHIICVPLPNKARTLSSFELASKVREVNESVTAADSVHEGYELARLLAGDAGVILCFGSLSYLGEIRSKVVK